MADQEVDTERIIVVGLNRPKLSKIIALIEDGQKKLESSELDGVLKVEIVPCRAAMGSYEAEDGSKVRYMESFVYHDGSAMTRLFDDEDFRSTITTVLMVGYEWKGNDIDQVKNYFQANNFPLPIKCVEPSAGFKSLEQEMEFFKNLNDDEKSNQLTEQTLGPGKMAKFVLDDAQRMKEKMLEKLRADATEAVLAEEKEPEAEEKKPDRQPIDPKLPRYACRICRTVLFGEKDLAQEHVQNLHSFKKANYNAKRPTVACQSIFCSDTVLEWLSVNGQDVEGKLACPKCSYKIGHWKWSGAQCSCGTWVTPAIQIPSSKVDTMLPASDGSGIAGVMSNVWSPNSNIL
jgi:dual specificity phosphatase 12